MTTLIPKYDQGATGAVNRPFNLKLQESVSVMDFGATGNGTTDDTVAVQAALASGKNIVFPQGTYLISSPLNITTAGQILSGNGGILLRASGAMESNYVLNATSINNLTFEGLQFAVQTGTAHAQNGGFILLTTCNFIEVFDCSFNGKIPGLSTQTESIFSAVNTPSCNHILISRNKFSYIYGNCCGANNSTGSGAYGVDVAISNNSFYNTVDTGIGNWTGAYDITITGNIFYKDDYSTAYNGVMIDVAGASQVVIDGNSLTGNAIGVRVLTNVSYTDSRIIISNNTFQNQVAPSGYQAQAIEISHNDFTGGGSLSMSAQILGNTITPNSSAWGINITSTVSTLTNFLFLRVDQNTFDLQYSSSIGVVFQEVSGKGAISMFPGSNSFIGNAGTPTTGNFPSVIQIAGAQTNNVFMRSNFQFTGTTATALGYFPCGVGLYAMSAALGTCTDGAGVGGQLVLNPIGSSNLPNYATISSSSSNTTFTNVWNHVTTPGNYAYTFNPASAGNTDNYYYLNCVRLI